MDRSLVKLDGECKLRMHDMLWDMGRDIVKEAGGSKHWTHLWDAASATKLPLLHTLDLSWCRRLEENVGKSVPKLTRLGMRECSDLSRKIHLSGDIYLCCCFQLSSVCRPMKLV